MKPARTLSRTPIYLGDEVSATGYRLAGIETLTPAPDTLTQTFRDALARTDLLLLSVEAARALPSREVEKAVAGLSPLVLVVPDVRNRFPLRDLPVRIARELGMGS